MTARCWSERQGRLSRPAVALAAPQTTAKAVVIPSAVAGSAVAFGAVRSPGNRETCLADARFANRQAADRLKSKGEGHLTRINDTLTDLMEAERRSKTAS
jgi:uncharacterized protein (DUF4415 family)